MNGAGYPGCPGTVVDALAAGRELREPRWGIGTFFAAFSAMLVATGLVGAGLQAAGLPGPVWLLAGTVAGWIAAVAWMQVALSRRGNGIRIDLGVRFTRSDVRIGIVGGVIALGAGALVGLATAALSGAFTSSAGEALEGFLAADDGVAAAAFLVLVAVGAPVVEELLVRGLLFAALRKRGVSTAWTVVLTAAAFALMHLEPQRIALIAAMGIVLGIVRARTGSVGAAMVGHGVVNTIQVVAVVATLVG